MFVSETWSVATGRLGEPGSPESGNQILGAGFRRVSADIGFSREPTDPLSARATRGFRTRLENSTLRYPSAFMRDLKRHERLVKN